MTAQRYVLFLLTILAFLAGSFASAQSINGSSLFLEAPEYNSGGAGPDGVAVGDLNGDGKLDVVLANTGCVPASVVCGTGSVAVLLGNGVGTFQAAVTYSSGGTRPTFVALGDVNGDGRLDVVVVAAGSGCQNMVCTDGTVSVLLGNGDGTLQPAMVFDSGGVSAQTMALADLNGDGKLDVVVDNLVSGQLGNNGNVAVLLGNGDGTFRPAVPYSVGLSPLFVTVADVNGDSKPDLLVANYCQLGQSCGVQAGGSGGSVGVLLGKGDGTFLPEVEYGVGRNSEGLAVGDVNGDGIPDVVVSEFPRALQVLLGKGDGTFQVASVGFIDPGSSNPGPVALADVNGDGKLDILVANSESSAGGASMAVLLGNGNATFQPAQLFSTNGSGGQFGFLAVADINGDGKPDVVITNECSSSAGYDPCTSGSIAIMLGKGDGTFHAARDYEVPYTFTGAIVQSIAAGDVNGDGKPDLVLANECAGTNPCSGSAEVRLGNGDGTFQAPISYTYLTTFPNPAQYLVAVAVVDLNGDGKLDMIITLACASIPSSGACFPGSFQNLEFANSCLSSQCPNGTIGILLGKGDGTFTPLPSPVTGAGYDSAGLFASALVVADVNGDGKPDLVVANQCVDSNCANGSVAVLLGNGDGTFKPAVTYNSGGVGAVALAVSDLNGDGKPDIVVANSGCGKYTCVSGTGSVAVVLGNGDGTFQPAVAYPTGGLYPVSVAAGDMNDDGKPDLVVANYACSWVVGTGYVCGQSTVGVLLGNGNGTFQAAKATSAPQLNEGKIALTDFNGDGKLDVAIGSSSYNGDFLLFGNGDGTFQPLFPLGASGPAITAADLNGDGKPDLAVGGLNVLLNIRPAATTTTLVSSANPSYVNQMVTFTATVAGQGATPTGSVNFQIDGGITSATVALVNGVAKYSTMFAAAGAHTVNAAYTGDSGNALSVSSTLKQNAIQPVLTFSGSPQQPLTTDGSGNFVAQVTITNTGNVTVSSVQVTSATLGSGALLSAPAAITNLAPGSSAVVTLTFPPNSVPSGATTAPLKISGTYSVTSPALNGNWALSFRSVTL